MKQQSTKNGNMMLGFYWSILGMLGMLVMVGGGVATLIYKASRPSSPSNG